MKDIAKRNKAKVWLDVIFALFIREIRVRFNDKLGISWAVIEPVLFILVLSFVRGRITGGATYSIPTFVFIAYGLVLIQLFLQTFNNTSNSIKKNRPLFAFRQVQPISAVLSSALFELLIKLSVAIALYIFVVLMDIEAQFSNPILMLLVLFELWLLAISLGLVFGILNLFIPEIKKVENLITRPLFFISAVFFSLRDFPQEYWYLLNWNPILHAIELMRFGAFSSYGVVGVSHAYLLMVMLAFMLFSLAIYKSYWKQAISQ